MALRGQVPVGAQYPGQAPSTYGLQQHPGQHLIAGTSEDVPVRDARKCTKTRVVEDKTQHCNGYAVKDREPKLCVGHHRERDKELANGDDTTADEGLHQASS